MTRHPAAGPSTPEHAPPAVRVAAYTRVTALDRRRPSNLECRQAHLTAFVAAQPGWRLVASYADVGPGRPDRAGLRRLLVDAGAGRFDLVVTDDLDRLSRDGRELARIARHLAARGMPIAPVGESARRRGAAALTSLVISDYL